MPTLFMTFSVSLAPGSNATVQVIVDGQASAANIGEFSPGIFAGGITSVAPGKVRASESGFSEIIGRSRTSRGWKLPPRWAILDKDFA